MITAAFLTICLGILTAGAVAVIWSQEWGSVQKAKAATDATEKANQDAAESGVEPTTPEAFQTWQMLRGIKEQCEKTDEKDCSTCWFNHYCTRLPEYWEI